MRILLSEPDTQINQERFKALALEPCNEEKMGLDSRRKESVSLLNFVSWGVRMSTFQEDDEPITDRERVVADISWQFSERLLAGEDFEPLKQEIVKRYPEYAEELVPALEMTRILRDAAREARRTPTEADRQLRETVEAYEGIIRLVKLNRTPEIVDLINRFVVLLRSYPPKKADSILGAVRKMIESGR